MQIGLCGPPMDPLAGGSLVQWLWGDDWEGDRVCAAGGRCGLGPPRHVAMTGERKHHTFTEPVLSTPARHRVVSAQMAATASVSPLAWWGWGCIHLLGEPSA